jgi:hypothetical protein
MSQEFDRRRVIKIVTIGGVAATLILPSKWTRPIVQSVIVPAHAQASPVVVTTTAAPSTTTLVPASTTTLAPASTTTLVPPSTTTLVPPSTTTVSP